MPGGNPGTGATLVERVERVLAGGRRCASCFVQVLADEGVEVPSQVSAIAGALERGVAGTGSVCGVYVAALLVRDLADDRASAGADPGRGSSPRHEWLDAFTPFPPEAWEPQPSSSLAERLAAFAMERYGGTDCRHISGTGWPVAGASQARLHAATGGVERCSQFIAEATGALLEQVDAEPG